MPAPSLENLQLSNQRFAKSRRQVTKEIASSVLKLVPRRRGCKAAPKRPSHLMVLPTPGKMAWHRIQKHRPQLAKHRSSIATYSNVVCSILHSCLNPTAPLYEKKQGLIHYKIHQQHAIALQKGSGSLQVESFKAHISRQSALHGLDVAGATALVAATQAVP